MRTLYCIVLHHYILDIPYINKGKMSNPKNIERKEHKERVSTANTSLPLFI